MTKQIKLRIYPDGIVQAEVEGIKGKKCTNYIGIIEELLEAKVVDSEYTPEYYEEEIIETYEEDNITLKEGI
ncbi:DUF2997 domain-containing protein [Clostridium botulinum]|uniref:DUF2997 domain-containing protein n=1 Tax=Clostridium botulinum TaxID=1491 RepID=A0A6B4JUM3_CLOBO|nr:DUF2997 domain-containing protein [Clostridium botulinum]KRU24650.1 hypothetical protein VT28_36060 [Clostridium sporogenes]KRU26395.1 hypothetical protein WG71_26000 [Clostridium sporogenes]KRU35591.1 hypothetical protein VT91_01150 [Clostridium sporogenes]KRU40657.1 hypothetical protein VT95_25300 [Clostridium sporogenes]MBZ1329689.1 DUF2997 domain-containing protein [Clostridium botulinum]